jgi:hypothetical protein
MMAAATAEFAGPTSTTVSSNASTAGSDGSIPFSGQRATGSGSGTTSARYVGWICTGQSGRLVQKSVR